jgi:hypothetical protein
MIMLLMVGYGVKEFRNFTSESHDGCRDFVMLVVVLLEPEPPWPPVEVKPGISRAGMTLLIKVSMNGSPVVTLGIDDCA